MSDAATDPGGGAVAKGRSGSGIAFPTRRARHLLETESTEAQSATEEECAPFFVDLRSLSEGELDHLRGLGMLPPLPDDDGNRVGSPRRKVSRILGADDDDHFGAPPRIELLGDDATPAGSTDADDGEDDGENENTGDGPPSDLYAVRLLRKKHAAYLTRALSVPLPRGFVSLDASHPWMVYWCLHSLDLLGCFDGEDSGKASLGGGGRGALGEVEALQRAHLLERVVSTLRHCWTDVPLEFDAHEVADDVRLKRLHEEQNGSNGNAPPSTAGEKVNIVGGGFGGGPGQMPHCAPTYAGVLALCIVAGVGLGNRNGHPYVEAGKSALEILSRRRLQLYAYFLTLREREGGRGEEERMSFRMQHDGEVDVRASYCILAPCHLLGLLGEDGDSSGGGGNPLRSSSIPRHVASCQTFEGGFGAEPSNEAHGGYTFCALAALRILGAVPSIDVGALRSWLARRQMGFEGGFCGRTNKLVDGCYSFWQGGATAVLDGWLREGNGSLPDGGLATPNGPSYDEVMLQRYILLCAQDVNGGLRDKPSKPKDFYHSCYNLSGLSVAQHTLKPWPSDTGGDGEVEGFNRLFGDGRFNAVGRTDPVINIRVERVGFMLAQKFC